MKKNILLLFILFIFVTVSASGITVNKEKKWISHIILS